MLAKPHLLKGHEANEDEPKLACALDSDLPQSVRPSGTEVDWVLNAEANA